MFPLILFLPGVLSSCSYKGEHPKVRVQGVCGAFGSVFGCFRTYKLDESPTLPVAHNVCLQPVRPTCV